MKGKGKSRAAGQGGGEPYRCRGRVWVEGPDGTFLGYGRVVLLERIREHGSIAKAARSMEMSYKHAWDLVDSMNRQAPAPLVVTATGGRGGGGARLTAAGDRAVAFFWSFYGRFKEFVAKETKALDWADPPGPEQGGG